MRSSHRLKATMVASSKSFPLFCPRRSHGLMPNTFPQSHRHESARNKMLHAPDCVLGGETTCSFKFRGAKRSARAAHLQNQSCSHRLVQTWSRPQRRIHARVMGHLNRELATRRTQQATKNNAPILESCEKKSSERSTCHRNTVLVSRRGAVGTIRSFWTTV